MTQPHEDDVDSAFVLNGALRRNIDAVETRSQLDESTLTPQERLAERITRFAGTMLFVYLHLALVIAWIALHLGLFGGGRAFDPNLNILAMIASVEAIFISIFVLISQNRMAMRAAKQAALDLHISLLTEHEVTRLAHVVSAIAERLDIKDSADMHLSEARRDVSPDAVLDEIEASQQRIAASDTAMQGKD